MDESDGPRSDRYLGWVSNFVSHYYAEKNHQALNNKITRAEFNPLPESGPIICRSRLGGQLNDYDREAEEMSLVRVFGQYGLEIGPLSIGQVAGERGFLHRLDTRCRGDVDLSGPVQSQRPNAHLSDDCWPLPGKLPGGFGRRVCGVEEWRGGD